MELADAFVGVRVVHYRNQYGPGVIEKLVEQPEPAPIHAVVMLDTGFAVTIPLNQLSLLETSTRNPVDEHTAPLNEQ